MQKETIKISYAERAGALIHISEFQTGGLQSDCLCLECRHPLIARVGTVRQPHFAHPAGIPACAPETILHQLGKRLIAQHIEEALREQKPFLARWKCSLCGGWHKDNLLEGIHSCVIEAQVGPVRPDLTLCWRSGGPASVIEIVVSHPPEQSALDYYEARDLKVWQIWLSDDTDIEALKRHKDGCTAVLVGDHCPLPRCEKCRWHLKKRHLHIVSTPCWNCDTTMQMAMVGYEDGQSASGPDKFTEEEIRQVCRRGVLIQNRRQRDTQERCAVNVCEHCGTHIGPFYLHRYDHLLYNHPPIASLSVGCERCETYRSSVTEVSDSHSKQWRAPSIAPARPHLSRPCKQCGGRLRPRFLFLFEGRVPVIMYGRRRGFVVGPAEFTRHERQQALEHGAVDWRDQPPRFYRRCGRMLEDAQVDPVGFFSLGCQSCRTVEPLKANSDEP